LFYKCGEYKNSTCAYKKMTWNRPMPNIVEIGSGVLKKWTFKRSGIVFGPPCTTATPYSHFIEFVETLTTWERKMQD